MKVKRYYLRISHKLGHRMAAQMIYVYRYIIAYATNCNILPHHYRFLFPEFPIVRQTTESPKVSFILIEEEARFVNSE